MKNISHLERVFQILIILACFIILIFRFSSVILDAQTSCLPDKPPLMNDPSPQYNAWDPNRNISVVIFEKSNGEITSSTEFEMINAAIREWNSVAVSGCSNVTFGNATRAGRIWDGIEPPPDDTVYVVRTSDRNGEWKGRFSTFEGLMAGRL